jgi:hypothetical protein
MFEAAVKASGSAQVTAASVKKGLYTFHDETFGGLTVPLRLRTRQRHRVGCRLAACPCTPPTATGLGALEASEGLQGARVDKHIYPQPLGPPCSGAVATLSGRGS